MLIAWCGLEPMIINGTPSFVICRSVAEEDSCYNQSKLRSIIAISSSHIITENIPGISSNTWL